MLINNFLQGLVRNQTQIAKLQESIASGKQINKPSDDPVSVPQILGYKMDLKSFNQYRRNIDQAKNWLNISSTALTDLKELVVRAKEIAIAQSSSTADASTRIASAQEIEAILDQAVQLANTKLGSRYIFSGYKTDTAPFSSSSGYKYSGDEGEISLEISSGIYIVINMSGSTIFNDTNGENGLLAILDNLKTALENDDQGSIAAQLDELNDSLDQILKEISRAGAKIQRLETTQERLVYFESEITKFLSAVEDVDITKAVTELTAKQLAYEASLVAAKRVVQPSLLDFLR
jgi:flagellar hook-associated protein 3 FlgL